MALQSPIPFSAVEKIFEGAGAGGATRWLATPKGKPHLPAALVFAATQFVDDQLMFFVLAKAYETRPSVACGLRIIWRWSPNSCRKNRKTLKMSRKIPAAIGTAAFMFARRSLLKSMIVKPPKINGKATVSEDLNDASRTVNIDARDADRTFELVTGAWAKTMPGGAHPQAFRGALISMSNMLTDIDRRFSNAVKGVGRQATYSAYPMRMRLLEEELQKARQFNLQVN